MPVEPLLVRPRKRCLGALIIVHGGEQTVRGTGHFLDRSRCQRANRDNTGEQKELEVHAI
jgi:hypothetical protein